MVTNKPKKKVGILVASHLFFLPTEILQALLGLLSTIKGEEIQSYMVSVKTYVFKAL